MPGPEHNHQRPRWPAHAVDVPGRRLHRLLRPPLGAELGKALRAGLGAARREMIRHTKEEAVKKFVAAAAGALLLAMVAPALAHHSFAMYDQTTSKTMTGKLVRYIPGANQA